MAYKRPTVRNAYDPVDRADDYVPNGEPSLTQQHFEKECNINNIMAQYIETGLLPDFTSAIATYADCTTASDYQHALALIQDADDLFNSMEARVRDRFRNDPAEFLAFVTNPANKAEAQQLGLFKAEPPPAPAPTPPAPTPPTPPAQAPNAAT